MDKKTNDFQAGIEFARRSDMLKEEALKRAGKQKRERAMYTAMFIIVMGFCLVYGGAINANAALSGFVAGLLLSMLVPMGNLLERR